MADDSRVDPLSADEEIADQGVEDIDKTLSSVGLPNDDKGPKELNSEQVIEEADKNQT